MLLDNTRKITYTAALTAISFVMVLATRLPFFSVFPLIIATLVLYYDIAKCGIVWGMLSALATFGFAYLVAQPTAVVYGLMFAPYAVLGYYLSKLKVISKNVTAIIRDIILVVFFNLALAGVYNLSSAIFGMQDLVEKLWGLYPVFAAVMSVLFLLCDAAFRFLYDQLVLRKIFK